MHFAGSNLSTDPKCPKCIYKISKNFRVEKSGEISRNLRFSRFFVPASKSDTHHGWGSRIRTYECQSQSLVPYRLAIPQDILFLVEQQYYSILCQRCQVKKQSFLEYFFAFFSQNHKKNTRLISIPQNQASAAQPFMRCNSLHTSDQLRLETARGSRFTSLAPIQQEASSGRKASKNLCFQIISSSESSRRTRSSSSPSDRLRSLPASR